MKFYTLTEQQVLIVLYVFVQETRRQHILNCTLESITVLQRRYITYDPSVLRKK
jgi:hypothetical protein